MELSLLKVTGEEWNWFSFSIRSFFRCTNLKTATLIAEKTEAIIDGTLEVAIVEEEFISNVIGTVNP